MENKPQPPTFENLLEAIQEIITAIQKHKGPIKMTPELIADIDKLEKAVGDFKEDTEELFDLLDIDIENEKKEFLESSNTKSQDKQLLKRAKDIQQEALAIKLALTKVRSKGRKGNQLSQNQNTDKQQMKERRKLFKSIGGDKKWLPL